MRKGSLISLDGLRQADLKTAGRRLARQLGGKDMGGVSTWDASGVFYELFRAGDKHGVPSAKTLLTLYASDLAFRLRWEIEPGLKDGYVVVAAPYVETAIAFAQAAGVPRNWVESLLSFAPAPAASYRLPEEDGAACWTGRRTNGFAEYVCATLATSSGRWTTADLLQTTLKHLKKAKKLKELE